MEVFYIKIKVKSIIKNIDENTENLIETFAIQNKNKIKYQYDGTKYNLIIDKQEILFIRETKDFIHKFVFKLDNITKSEYYIKELNTNIDICIKTTKIKQNEKYLEIDYETLDNNSKYSYILDME